MELQGEDGCVVSLSETLKKELGRGPGIVPHDLSVSRRQVRLQVSPISSPSSANAVAVAIEVLGPNPICVLHASSDGGDLLRVEIVKAGTRSSLKLGDQFSLSIQEPVFYTLRRPQLPAHHSTKLWKEGEQQAVDDEEEGIAEAVARWQRRKQERWQAEERTPWTGESKAQDGSQQELVDNQAVSREANEPEQVERATTDEDDADVAKRFGFIVEGSEFERYGKKGLDTRKWDWQIGRPSGGEDDDDEEEGGGLVQKNRTAPGPSTRQKAKPRSEDDDDDWRGDSDGEKARQRPPPPRKKDVQTRSQNLADPRNSETTADPRKKRKMVSPSDDVEHPSRGKGDSKVLKPSTASTSAKKNSKRKPRASESEEEEEDDDDGEDLVGFLVEDAEEEEEEVADEEDEWTDEDDAMEDDDEIEEDPAPGRPAVDEDDEKPLCKYGNNCFRKNKDHLAQFRH